MRRRLLLIFLTGSFVVLGTAAVAGVGVGTAGAGSVAAALVAGASMAAASETGEAGKANGASDSAAEGGAGDSQKRAILMLKGQPRNSEQLKKEFNANYVGKPLRPPRVTPADRDALFLKAGFASGDFVGFDQLEKDLFLRRVKHAKWADVLARYPKFSPAKMAKLKELAKKDSRI